MGKILLIDDEILILENLKFVLELEDFEVIDFDDPQEALSYFRENTPLIDAIITDMRLPGLSGLELIDAFLQYMPEIGIIVLTGHGDMDNAIQALKRGAFDYILKPTSSDNLIHILQQAILKKNMALEIKQMQKQIQEQNQYLLSIMDSAKTLISNLLPKFIPQIPSLSIDTFYQCCDEVGGDIYDICRIDDSHLYFYICDISSHGILSAVVASLVKSTVDYHLKFIDFSCISDFLHTFMITINNEVLEKTSPDTFATMFIGILNIKTHVLHYASAGHIPQYVLRSGVQPMELLSNCPILGMFRSHMLTFSISETTLCVGDTLLCFSDGAVEIFDLKGYMLDTADLENILSSISIGTGSTIASMLAYLHEYQNSTLFRDDLTMISIQKKA